MKQLLWGILAISLLAACRSSRHIATEGNGETIVAAKLQLTYADGEGKPYRVDGQLKMARGERIRLSLLMPVLRTEMVRIEVTPDGLLVVDRKHREYVQATPQEVANYLPQGFDLARMEQVVLRAARSGDATLTGKELGIPSLDDARIRLYNFSHGSFSLPPTKLSDKYNQIPWENLMQMISDQL